MSQFLRHSCPNSVCSGPENGLSPESQKLIAEIHRIYEEVERRQSALPPPKDDAERLIRMGEIDQAVRYWISARGFSSSSLTLDHRAPVSQAEWAEINLHDLANQSALKAMLPLLILDELDQVPRNVWGTVCGNTAARA